MCNEDAEKEEEREHLCTAVVCWNESEQAGGGEFRDAHEGCEGWRQLGIGLQGFWWSWKSQVLNLSGNIPFSG